MTVTKDTFKIKEYRSWGDTYYSVYRAKLKRNIFMPWTHKVKWELVNQGSCLSLEEAREYCQKQVDNENYNKETIITFWPHKCS